MAILTCRCGNDSKWKNLNASKDWAQGTCGNCGATVFDPNPTAISDDTTITGLTVSGISAVGNGNHITIRRQ